MGKMQPRHRALVWLLALVMVLAVALPTAALKWAGLGTDSGNATASSNGSHSIPYGNAGQNVFGFRFTAIDKNGNRKGSGKSLDVWTTGHETAWETRYRASKLFYKGEYANNWIEYKEANDDSLCLDEVSTKQHKYQMTTETSLGFDTALPSGNVNYGDAFKAWAENNKNCNILAIALGYTNGIASMGSGDKIVVEPIFACKIDGEDVLLTVTEIACFGRDKYGAYENGTMGGTGSGKFGFISRFTNMEYPGAFL